MERPLIFASLADAKRAIATRWLGPPTPRDAPLGSITLRPHQREAVDRILRTLDGERVALLADDVGLGKTYVAIAVAAAARAPLIVAPASLRDMWRDALAAATVRAEWTSYERLSRGAMPVTGPYDLVILDEAHHARTPTTRRYARLASLAAGARLLLLSATPIHNSLDDLTALFALALGRSARGMDDAAIATRTVRRTHRDVPAEPLPAIATREWIRVPDDEDLLERLLALPPPLPPREGGDGGVLLEWTLVRLWASTRGALRGALRRRLQRGWALHHALRSGVHPSREELAAWQCSDRAVQLAFPELIAPGSSDTRALLNALEPHLGAIEALLAHLTSVPNPDAARVDALRALRRSFPGERILVFTQFADSANALWRLMRADPGVGVLTSRGAEIAGGTISRREALRRFAPRALRARTPSRIDAIELLIATDLLSEGVNLQDASVVVHLDLPWTHARLAQRVGRARRMGSEHASVRVFTFAPPAASERLLEVERRITRKLGAAARTLGIAGAILPSVLEYPPAERDSPARATEELRALIASWRRGECGAPLDHCAMAVGGGAVDSSLPAVVMGDDGGAMAATVGGDIDGVATIVSGDANGALAALIDEAGHCVLAAEQDGVISSDPRVTLAVARALEAGMPSAPDERLVRDACRRFERWAEARAAARNVGGALSIEGSARRATLRRLAAIASRMPIARRQELSSLTAEARRIAASAIGIGGELILGQLATAQMPDDAWLRAVAAFAEAHPLTAPEPNPASPPRVVAMILSRATL